MSTADMVTKTKIIHLCQKSLQMDQVPNMAYQILLVSKILGDPINDFQKILDFQIMLVVQHSSMACPIL